MTSTSVYMKDGILEGSLEIKFEMISGSYAYLAKSVLDTIQNVFTGVWNHSQTKLGSWPKGYKAFFSGYNAQCYLLNSAYSKGIGN